MKFKRFLLATVLLSALLLASVPLSEDSSATDVGDVRYYAYSGGKEISAGETIEILSGNSSTLSFHLFVPDSVSPGTRLVSMSVMSAGDMISSVDLPGEVAISPGGGTSVDVTFHSEAIVHGDTEAVIRISVLDVNTNTPTSGDVNLNFSIISTVASEDSYNKIIGIFPNNLEEPFNQPAYSATITFVFWVFFGLLLAYVIIPAVLWIPFKHNKSVRGEIVGGINRTIVLITAVFGIAQALRVYGAPDRTIALYDSLYAIIVVLMGAVVVWRIYLVTINHVFRKIGDNVSVGGVDETLIPLFRMIGQIVIGTVAVAAIFSALGANLISIIAGAGIAGLALSLGAQSMLNQFFSGLMLLISRPFGEGDIVKVGSEASVLKVNRVGIMNTRFYHNDNEMIITMPNNMVTSSVIYNYTKENRFWHIYVYFEVAYGSDMDKAKSIMMDVALDNPKVMKDGSVPMPGVRMTSLKDSSVTLRLSVYVYDYKDSFSVDGQLREKIYQEFRKNGIEIPLPQLDVNMKGEKQS